MASTEGEGGGSGKRSPLPAGHIRVILESRRKEYAVERSVMFVPSSTTCSHLSALLAHMLADLPESLPAEGSSDLPAFAFYIRDRPFVGEGASLASLLGDLELSHEDVCVIEYDIPTALPSPDWQAAEPDWIRAVAIERKAGPSFACLTGSFDRTVRLYVGKEGAAGAPLASFLGAPDAITVVQWINEDALLAACADGTMLVWRRQRVGLPTLVLRTGACSSIQTVAVIKETAGEGGLSRYTFVAGDFEGSIHLFGNISSAHLDDYTSPLIGAHAEILRTPPIAEGGEERTGPSPLKRQRGKARAAADPLEGVRLLRPTRSWQAHQGPITTILTGRAAATMYTLGWDKQVRTWTVSDGLMVHSFGVPESISAACLSLDKANIIMGHASGTVRCMALPTDGTDDVKGDPRGVRKDAHCGWISSIAVDPKDPHRFLSAGHDGRVAIWDRRCLKEALATFPAAGSGGGPSEETRDDGSSRRRTARAPPLPKILSADWGASGVAYGGEDCTIHTLL